MSKDLAPLQHRIDVADSEIIRLLSERFATSESLGLISKDIGTPVLDQAREATVLTRIHQHARCGHHDEIAEVFNKIMEVGRRIQNR